MRRATDESLSKRGAHGFALAALVALLAIGCGDGEGSRTAEPGPSAYPPTAKVALHEEYLADLAAKRDASDGGGSARLVLPEGEDGSVTAGGRGRWRFEYRAGELGIARGGSLQLLVSPYWGWSPPQPFEEGAPGYTTLECSTPEVELLPSLYQSLLVVELGGRELREGETITLCYGAGPALAIADLYAERESPFWFKVDGDGDGVAELVPDPPAVDVLPGPATRLSATLASAAEPGAKVRLVVAALDAMANTGVRVAGPLRLASEPEGLLLPEPVALVEEDLGRTELELTAGEAGFYRVRVTLESDGRELTTLSNPLRVAEGLEPLYWGDLHGHSNYSDGTGLPEDYYRYARDVAGLDVIVLTDHDHFGVPFLDAAPERWEEIRAQVKAFDEPGRFVALLGFEWTSWLYGHRHVVYFDGEGEVLSSVGASTTTPRELWDALEGRAALSFAHHSAGAPIAIDWSFVPDPEVEPVTEVSSVHGSSEAADSPSLVRGSLRGNFVRDQLEQGMRFGFVGSGDSHDGHPGLPHLSPAYGYRPPRPDLRGPSAERTAHLARLRPRGAEDGLDDPRRRARRRAAPLRRGRRDGRDRVGRLHPAGATGRAPARRRGDRAAARRGGRRPRGRRLPLPPRQAGRRGARVVEPVLRRVSARLSRARRRRRSSLAQFPFRRIVRLPRPRSTATRSRSPSPSRSAGATATGSLPGGSVSVP